MGRAGSVGVQEAAGRLAQGFRFVRLAPRRDPLVGSRERDLRAPRRPLAQLTEEEREAGAQPRAWGRADPPDHLLYDLLPQEAATVEHLAHRRAHRGDLLAVERRMVVSVRVAPRRKTRILDPDCAARRVPQRQLRRRMQVQRPTERPRLHELTPIPERLANACPGDPVDTGCELELR